LRRFFRIGRRHGHGWINRALPADELGEFVRSLAHRIAKFPAGSLAAVKDRVNAIALAAAEDFRRDSDLSGEGARKPEARGRFQAAFKRGFQTRDSEMDFAGLVIWTDRPIKAGHDKRTRISCLQRRQTAETFWPRR